MFITNSFRKMKTHAYLLLIVLFVLGACSQGNRQAQQLLDRATAAFEAGQLENSKNLIDSIKILFPKAYETRHAGNELLRQVEKGIQQRNIQFMDSTIQVRTKQVEDIRSKYAYERDTAYQQTGRFLDPSQVIEKNTSRSFLRFQTEEDGRMSITSVYVGGSNIHHTSVKVTAPDGTYAETPSSADSYETTDMGLKIEKADYPLEKDGGLTNFICQHAKDNLKMQFIGDRTVNVPLTASDRQACVKVYELSQLLSEITSIKAQIEEAQTKIRFIDEMAKRTAEESANE